MRPALPLVLFLLVAGCAAPVDTATVGDDLLPPGLLPVVSDVHAVVDAELGGRGEPTLGVAADGTLFVNGRDNVGTPAPEHGGVYRSRDGGLTWEHLGTPTFPMPDLDPDLAVDADGVLWFDTLWVGCTTVAVSHDQGDTWEPANPLACTPPAGDRQYVIPTRGGTAYTYAHNLPTFWHVGAKTTDYGRTWTPLGLIETPDHHLLVNEGSTWGGGGFWNPATDSVYFTFSWRSHNAWWPAYAVTRDGGLTWEIGKLQNAGGQPHGLALTVGAADEAGNVYLAWSETHPRSKDSGVYYASSADDGRTWSAPKRADAAPTSSVFPAITAGAAGEIAIAAYEATEPGAPDEVSENNTWNVTLAWTRDALADAPTFERGLLSQNPVKDGIICISGAGCNGDRELLDYFSIKRLPDGRVGGVWTSTLEEEDRVLNVYGATAEPVLSPWAAAGAA